MAENTSNLGGLTNKCKEVERLDKISTTHSQSRTRCEMHRKEKNPGGAAKTRDSKENLSYVDNKTVARTSRSMGNKKSFRSFSVLSTLHRCDAVAIDSSKLNISMVKKRRINEMPDPGSAGLTEETSGLERLRSIFESSKNNVKNDISDINDSTISSSSLRTADHCNYAVCHATSAESETTRIQSPAAPDESVEKSKNGWKATEGQAKITGPIKPVGNEETKEDRLRRTIFVGNLPLHVKFTSSQLYRHLTLEPKDVESHRFRSIPVATKFARQKRAGILRKQFLEGVESQNAYVVLKDTKLIKKCLARNGSEFMNRVIRVDIASRDGFSKFDRKRSIFVGGLKQEVSEQLLADGFKIFGNVVACRIVRDRVTHKSKGFGFVLFSDRVSVAKAVLSGDQILIRGTQVRVTRALSEEQSKAEDEKRKKVKKKGGIPRIPPALARILRKKELKMQKRREGRESRQIRKFEK